MPLRRVLTAALIALTPLAAAATPKVVADIAPVHALVARVMEGAGEPVLLLPPGGSPHDFALRPSQAAALSEADLVVWIGPELTPPLEGAITRLAGDAEDMRLLTLPSTFRLKTRAVAIFETDDGDHDGHDHAEHAAADGDHGQGHDDHGHDEAHHDEHAHGDDHGHDDHGHDEAHHDDHADGHDDHAHGHDEAHHDDHGDDHADGHGDKHDDHGHGHDEAHHDEHADGHDDGHDEAHHDEHAHGGDDGHDDHGDDHADGHGHDDHGHSHAVGGTDPHAWLDPHNAGIWTTAIAERLAEIDPENADLYRANAAAAVEELEALEAELTERLAPVRGREYLVLHDAWQYFESRFDLDAAGAISPSDAAAPGPRRLAALQALVKERGIACAFVEPQLPESRLTAVTDGAGLSIGRLDPLGATLTPGPELYAALLTSLADEMTACLSDS